MPGGLAPGRVAVEAENDFVGLPQKLLDVGGRGSRSERRDGVFDTVLCERHHVHVAFDHDRRCYRADRGTRLAKTVELASFLDERVLRGVEVLRLPFAEPTAPKRDHRAALIENGEHDAVAKPVITPPPTLRIDHEARIFQRLVGIARKNTLQALPPIGRVADSEARRDFAGQAAALEIFDGARRCLQLIAIVIAGALHDLVQVRSAFGFLYARLEIRHLHADRFGEILYRFDVAKALVFDEEGDGVSVHAAAEAVIELLGRADGKRGRLLGVERAAGRVVRPALLQRDAALDHVHDVDAMEQFLLEGIRYHRRNAL